MTDDPLLSEQAAYYRARAPEYEDWWTRSGRFDAGEEENRRWFAEVAELERVVERFGAAGDVLELAGGTGIWTRRLVRTAGTLTVVDASAEVLSLNRARLSPGASVAWVVADLFDWEPPAAAFDVCFFGFWLSHVPEAQFAAFWQRVRSALRPGGRVLFVDSARAAGSPGAAAAAGETAERELADGRRFRIVKRFHEPAELERRLTELGWSVAVARTTRHFIHGHGRPVG
jgi:demethylmenaquinone methyltransferase/2-methoxy-6-polyprenyl-1,4-benzoquinol methylase